MLWNPKEQPMMKIRTNPHPVAVEELGAENPVYTITSKIHAQVVNALDMEIVSAIVTEAKEAGVTDLILIDKEFILSAIQHEMERRRLR
jgi:hypothetical protein